MCSLKVDIYRSRDRPGWVLEVAWGWGAGDRKLLDSWTRGWTRDEQWLSRESRSQWSPPVFLSLDTSLDIKTGISKVLIPVSISRLKILESRYQSRYQDSNFKILDSSLDIKTQLWKVSILVSMSRLDSWIYNLCPNLETGKCNLTNLQNPPLQKNCCNFLANVIICCPVRCWISFNLLVY